MAHRICVTLKRDYNSIYPYDNDAGMYGPFLDVIEAQLTKYVEQYKAESGIELTVHRLWTTKSGMLMGRLENSFHHMYVYYNDEEGGWKVA